MLKNECYKKLTNAPSIVLKDSSASFTEIEIPNWASDTPRTTDERSSRAHSNPLTGRSCNVNSKENNNYAY